MNNNAVTTTKLFCGAPLAEMYKVSRTPLREALRMLQEEGLVDNVHNQRALVKDFNLGDIEAISAQRILLSALATSLTVADPTWETDDLEAEYAHLQSASDSHDDAAWLEADRRFHAAHEYLAPPMLISDLRRLDRRNHLYQAIWMRSNTHADPYTPDEHEQILRACIDKDAKAAREAIARHRTRIAITVMNNAVPEYEPRTIRTALRLILNSQ